MLDEKQTESQASEVQEEETVETEEETTESKKDVDYQKELAQAQAELQKKGKQINQAEHVIEELKKKGTEINKDSIEEIVGRLVEDKIQSFTSQVRSDAIGSLIEQYASNNDEAALIKHHLEHSIRPSGDDITDILNAKALANKARFSQQNSEVERSKQATEAEKSTSAGEKTSKSKEAKYSAEDLKLMKAFNLSKEEVEKGIR